MSQSRNSSSKTVFTLTRCGILAAMAVILYYVEIPVIAFYKLDLSTLPAILAGFAMGPIQGFAVIVVKNLVHMLGSSTGCIGEFADIIMSSAFVIPAAILYRREKTIKSAVCASVAATVCMIIAGVLVNYFILIPAYQTLFHMSVEAILGMVGWSFVDSTIKLVLCVTAPFNLLKGFVLSVVTFLLYKRVSPLLHQKASR